MNKAKYSGQIQRKIHHVKPRQNSDQNASRLRAALQRGTSPAGPSQTPKVITLIVPGRLLAHISSQKIQAFVLKSRVNRLPYCSPRYNKVHLFQAMPSFSLVTHLPVWDGIMSKCKNSKYKARTWRELVSPWSRIFMVVNMSPDAFYGTLADPQSERRGRRWAPGCLSQDPASSSWWTGLLQTRRLEQ